MRIGISAKVVLLALCMIISFGLSLGYFVIRYQASVLTLEMNERVTVLMDNLAFNSEYPLLIKDEEAIVRLTKGILSQRDIVFCRIEDKSGDFYYEEGLKVVGTISEYTTPIVVKRPAEESGEELILGIPGEVEEEVGRIYLSVSHSELNEKLNNAIKIIAAAIIPSIIITSLTVYLLLRSLLGKPIKQLVRATEKISRGNLNETVPVVTRDEIGVLATSFNKMTENLLQTTVSRDYVDNIINNMMDALTVVRPDGTIKTVNFAISELLGYTADELIGESIEMIFAEDEEKTKGGGGKSPFRGLGIIDVVKKGFISNIEKTCLSKDGRKIPVLFSGSAMLDSEGDTQGIVCVVRDITERKNAEKALERTVTERDRSIEELRHLMDFSTVVSEKSSEGELITYITQSLKEYFDIDTLVVLMQNVEMNRLEAPGIDAHKSIERVIKKEVILNPIMCRVIRTGEAVIVKDIKTEPPCACLHCEIKEGGHACFPLKVGGKTIGTVLMIKEEKGYWDDEAKRGLILIYLRMAASAIQRIRLVDRIRNASITDALTGVYNRRFFDEALGKQMSLASRYNDPLCLMLADLDHFKDLNDTYGHIAGDRVLQQVTKVMSCSLRSSDTLARYGGEEFVIIMPKTAISSAVEKAEEVRKHVESINFGNGVEEKTIKITISIGIASFPEQGSDYDTLLQSADNAMYKAKNGGRNRVETL